MLSGVGTVRYRHLGVTTEDGVDLRAEVGLLSRNIKIHGEMEDFCYDNLCDYFNYDTFGGHIQVLYTVSQKNVLNFSFKYLSQTSSDLYCVTQCKRAVLVLSLIHI